MVTVTFEAERVTKNTIRFAEEENDLGPAPVIGTLYVQKHALKELAINGKVPSKLRVTVKVIE